MAKIKKIYKGGVEYEIGGGAIPVVNHGTSDTGTQETAYEIAPNVLHVWGTVELLNLSLGTGEAGVVNEYMFEFESGSTETSLSLPLTVLWQDTPDVEANMKYQVSIVNNIGLIVGVETV